MKRFYRVNVSVFERFSVFLRITIAFRNSHTVPSFRQRLELKFSHPERNEKFVVSVSQRCVCFSYYTSVLENSFYRTQYDHCFQNAYNNYKTLKSLSPIINNSLELHIYCNTRLHFFALLTIISSTLFSSVF